MGSGMNVEQAKELANKRNYKWAVGNLKRAYGISYKKATKILLHELAEIADRLVLCKDCMFSKVYQANSRGETARVCEAYRHTRLVSDDDFCSDGERIEE